jgi:hypothetical protein
MKNKENDNFLLVNMPDCSNLLFEFKDNIIVKSKKIADKNTENAISFYKLTSNIQNEIIKFLNPKAI